MKTTRMFLALGAVVVIAGSSAGATEEKISIEDLASWQFLGEGELKIDSSERAVRMSEAEGSKGLVLLSPRSYGRNVVVCFKAKPATYETVTVVLLSASDKQSGGEIKIPKGYDGSIGLWLKPDIQNYFVAFHNAAHKAKPFIRKNPGSVTLIEADGNVAEERWFDVEVGRRGARLWLKIDGAEIVETTDPEGTGLPGGRLGFRLRGTGEQTASCLIKDVVIKRGTE